MMADILLRMETRNARLTKVIYELPSMDTAWRVTTTPIGNEGRDSKDVRFAETNFQRRKLES